VSWVWGQRFLQGGISFQSFSRNDFRKSGKKAVKTTKKAQKQNKFRRAQCDSDGKVLSGKSLIVSLGALVFVCVLSHVCHGSRVRNSPRFFSLPSGEGLHPMGGGCGKTPRKQFYRCIIEAPPLRRPRGAYLYGHFFWQNSILLWTSQINGGCKIEGAFFFHATKDDKMRSKGHI